MMLAAYPEFLSDGCYPTENQAKFGIIWSFCLPRFPISLDFSSLNVPLASSSRSTFLHQGAISQGHLKSPQN